MNRILSSLLGLTLLAGPALAREDVRDAYDSRVSPSVVVLRKDAIYSKAIVDEEGQVGSMAVRTRGHCSATVIAEQKIEDLVEKILVTNFHCVDAGKQLTEMGSFPSGSLKSVSLSLVTNAQDQFAEDDTGLELWATNPDSDIAMVITSGGSDTSVADLEFDCSEVKSGTPLLTTGFPHGLHKQTVGGMVTVLNYRDNRLPYPKKVFSTDLLIDGGQSGSVATSYSMVDDSVSFCLEGLVYGNSNDNTTRLVTPIDSDELRLMMGGTNIPSKKPPLDADISEEKMSVILGASQGHHDVDGFRSFFAENDGKYTMSMKRLITLDALLNTEWVEIDFNLENGMNVLGVYVSNESGNRIRAEQKGVERLMRRLLNNYVELQRYRIAASNVNKTTEETNWFQYLDNLTDETTSRTRPDIVSFISALYFGGAVSDDFMPWH